jgi:hypothetical protein
VRRALGALTLALALALALASACGGAKLEATAQANASGVEARADAKATAPKVEEAAADETDEPEPSAPPPDAAREGPSMATLPGFRLLSDGRSRVTVQLTGGSTSVEESNADQRHVYKLRGVRVPEKVNRMVLPTGHFETPVQSVQLVQVDGDADLVIDMRAAAKPTRTKLRRNALGSVLIVEFPKVANVAVPKEPSRRRQPPDASIDFSSEPLNDDGAEVEAIE